MVESRRSVPTELECCVLAIIARLGPCTPYAVRKYLSQSQSSYWSASAGAIYPLLERLHAVGWVSCEEGDFGTRRRKRYQLARSGRNVLRAWLRAPVSVITAAYTHDPLRARVFFLDMISPGQRREMLDDAIAKTEHVLSLHRRDRDAQPDLSAWELAGREGAIRELQARLDWLCELRRDVESPER
jgi:DNA-binding PadR family transcriptional regulator